MFLQTQRLLLRLFTLNDAPEICALAGDPAVADTTLAIPQPYEQDDAQRWVLRQREQIKRGRVVVLAIERRADQQLVGAASLFLRLAHRRGELGYWIGKPYWNTGYATEAASMLIGYGFETLKLNRIYARHMTRNPASARVLAKLGMTHEATLRQHIYKAGRFEDIAVHALLREHWHPHADL